MHSHVVQSLFKLGGAPGWKGQSDRKDILTGFKLQHLVHREVVGSEEASRCQAMDEHSSWRMEARSAVEHYGTLWNTENH